MVRVKASFNDDIRRFTLDDVDFDSLKEKVRDSFALDQVELQVRDANDELVPLDSEHDLTRALEPDDNSLLRIFVHIPAHRALHNNGMVRVKATCDTQIRRFTLDGTRFATLSEKLRTLFALEDPMVKYRDADNDLVSVTSDAELALAVEEAENGLLRIVVSENIPHIHPQPHGEPVTGHPPPLGIIPPLPFAPPPFFQVPPMPTVPAPTVLPSVPAFPPPPRPSRFSSLFSSRFFAPSTAGIPQPPPPPSPPRAAHGAAWFAEQNAERFTDSMYSFVAWLFLANLVFRGLPGWLLLCGFVALHRNSPVRPLVHRGLLALLPSHPPVLQPPAPPAARARR